MCQHLTPMSCVLLLLQTTWMEKLERTMLSGISWKHSGNQMCTKERPLSKFKPQSPLTSECSTKLSLLERLQHCEGEEHDKYEVISQRKNKGEPSKHWAPTQGHWSSSWIWDQWTIRDSQSRNEPRKKGSWWDNVRLGERWRFRN